jgi:septum site-determining protein MinC
MAATLITASDPHHPHLLRLAGGEEACGVREEVRRGLALVALSGSVILEAGARQLRLPDLRAVDAELRAAGLRLMGVRARRPETLVAASAMGLEAWGHGDPGTPPGESGRTAPRPPLTVHDGTLRSGDDLHSEGSLLVLGDVNPGARISAAGHVLVWGRLRGMAHAGRDGDESTSIVALQLRPLQLRIADVVARGPQDTPPPGLAERARLVEGSIQIEPAPPGWPVIR